MADSQPGCEYHAGKPYVIASPRTDRYRSPHTGIEPSETSGSKPVEYLSRNHFSRSPWERQVASHAWDFARAISFHPGHGATCTRETWRNEGGRDHGGNSAGVWS